MNAFDVLIIGAGPAGSCAATLLARVGWSVVLVEKQPFPRRKVCGECIAASNLPLLDALGVGDAIDALAGPPLREVVLMRGDRAVGAALPPAHHASQRWGRALGREALDTLLLDTALAAGARLWQPWQVRTIDGQPGRWNCLVQQSAAESTRMLSAALLIDAHGSWEPAPWQRVPHFAHKRPGELYAFKANFAGAGLVPGQLPLLCLDGGYGGMVIADGGVMTLACCLRRDRLERARAVAPGLSAGEAVEALLSRECAGVRTALDGARQVDRWLGAGPLATGIHLRADDRVLRIGNAAGEAHPLLGEGISIALQSAWLLADLLLAESVDLGNPRWHQALSRRHARRWRRHFAGRLRLAALFSTLAMHGPTSALLMAAAQAWPGLLTLGARAGGKVHALDISGHGPASPPRPAFDPG